MASEVSFDGRRIILPGVYSNIKSGIKNPPLTLPYGNVLLIDTGSGAGYGGGAGINGENASGKNSVYPIDNIQDYTTLMKGGQLSVLGKPLFQPSNSVGVNGASLVYVVKAATTVSASLTFSPTGGGLNGGTLILKCRDEGLVGNGVISSSELSKGYAFKLFAGVQDSSKFILKIFLGTYSGLAPDGFPWNNKSESESSPKLILQSPEFVNFTDLISWVNSDSLVSEYFVVSTATASGDASINAADLVTYSAYTLAAGGTETYGSQDLIDVLEAVSDLRYTFLLSDKFGANAENAVNDDYLSHVLDANTQYEKMIFVGGGVDKTKFDSETISAAQHFNSDRVIVVHSGVELTSTITPTRLRSWNSLYHTALVLGRIAGLEPQTPGTFKILPISGVTHQMTVAEKEKGLQAGVLITHLDTQLLTPAYVILQAVNTLQNNLNMINEDGTTREISIRRISSQLNQDLIVNAREDLFNQEVGVNLFSMSDRVVLDWVSGQLAKKTVSSTEDNLILEFKNITVNTVQDSKFVTYEFKPNSPVNKFFLTGFMVN